MINFTITKTSTAGIETMFDTLTDHVGMADVTAIRKVTMERQGTEHPNGVGAVRKLELIGPPIREEITEFERPHRFAYKMLSGLPVEDHVGRAELRETSTGTEITYTVTSKPTIPGGQIVLGPILKKSIGDFMKGAIKAAERRT